jgi:hypothetical protein
VVVQGLAEEGGCPLSLLAEGITRAAQLDEEIGGSYNLRMYSGGFSANWLRMSKLGKCARALAYEKLGVEGKKDGPDSLFNFRLGRMMESDVVHLMRMAVRHNLFDGHTVKIKCTGANQREVALLIPLPDGAVLRCKGHCDGIVVVDGEEAVWEVKSIGNYMYGQFLKNGPSVLSSEWTTQKHCYMAATNIPKHRMVLVCKDMSRLKGAPRVSESVSELDRTVVGEAAQKAVRVATTTGLDNLPDREYDAPAKFPCSYCAYVSTCWHLSGETT